MAARTGRSPLHMVFWYNASKGADVYSYQWNLPPLPPENPLENRMMVESTNEVVVQPTSRSCTEEWTRGTVTGHPREGVVEVNGIPRHGSQVRPALDSVGSTVPLDSGEVVERPDFVPRSSRPM
ncbi:hypothetical protein Ciccas_003340 [Cichlidogyrus casuarinus]|uniref:Uncharacterized protein n=1 Tax=Cichlidogyrus casuarinus TaxID=1844966 RepID=A0ABD2QEQ9_9PLAT